MNKGIIEQLDSPQNIYANPQTEFVADFVGYENFIDLSITNKYGRQQTLIANDGKDFIVYSDREFDKNKIKGAIRPEEIMINNMGTVDSNSIKGKVGISTFMGKGYQYVVETELGDLIVNSSSKHMYKKDEQVTLYLPKEKIILV